MRDRSDGYTELARSHSSRGELVLRQRIEHGRRVVELRVNGLFVMDTAETSTERAMATRALKAQWNPASVLVGGLGLGFTAEAVLTDPRVQRCTVVEIEPELVTWLRSGLVPGREKFLADPRLRIVVDDVVGALAASPPGSLDLILLDIDNGPDNLVYADNARLYEAPALDAARSALRRGGTLVVWSAAPSPALQTTIETVFRTPTVLAEPLEVHLGERHEQYWLYTTKRG